MAFAPETIHSQVRWFKNSTKPTVSSISPTSATAGGASFTLTVNGTNFVSGALVEWVGSSTSSISTTLVSSSQLKATIPSTLLTAAGTVQVSVYDPGRGGGTSNAVTFTINPVPPTPLSITTASVPNGTASTAYTTTLAATGGTTPYTWSLPSGSTLPAGLTLSTSGTLSGTPTTAATYSFSVQVNDSASNTSTKVYSMTVAPTSATPGICVNGTYGVCGDPYEGLGPPPNQEAISACGITISTPGNYKVTQNIGMDPTATCLSINWNTYDVNLDLGGNTVTGTILDVAGNGNTIYNGTVTCNIDTSGFAKACVYIYAQITAAQARIHHLTVQNQHELNGSWGVATAQDNPATYSAGGSGLGMPCRMDHIAMTSITGTGAGNRYQMILSGNNCNTEADHNLLHCTGGQLNGCQGIGIGEMAYAYIHDNEVVMDPVTGTTQDGRGIICDLGAGVDGTCDVYNNIITATNNRAIRFREFPPGCPGGAGPWGIQHGNAYNNYIYNIQEGGRLAAIHIGEDDCNLMTTLINIYGNMFELNNGNGLVVVSATGVTAHDNTVTCYQGNCSSAGYAFFTDALGYSNSQTNAYFKNATLPSGFGDSVKVCGNGGTYGCSNSNSPGGESSSAQVCAVGTVVGTGTITTLNSPCP